jgi:hypothetical protein
MDLPKKKTLLNYRIILEPKVISYLHAFFSANSYSILKDVFPRKAWFWHFRARTIMDL